MPWLSSRPPGSSSRARLLRVDVDLARADVLDHADAGDRVEALAARGRGSPSPGSRPGRRRRPPRPAARARSACGCESVMPTTLRAVLGRGVDARSCPSRSRRRAPARPPSAPSLRADQLELRLLGLLERRRAAREDRAAVGHRLVEEEREELVGDVVVVADRAGVALLAVAAAARAQLGLRAARRGVRPAARDGGEQQRACAGGRAAAAASRRAARSPRRGRRPRARR